MPLVSPFPFFPSLPERISFALPSTGNDSGAFKLSWPKGSCVYRDGPKEKSFKVSLVYFSSKVPFIPVHDLCVDVIHHLIFSVSTGTISIGLVEETTTAGGSYYNIDIIHLT